MNKVLFTIILLLWVVVLALGHDHHRHLLKDEGADEINGNSHHRSCDSHSRSHDLMEIDPQYKARYKKEKKKAKEYIELMKQIKDKQFRKDITSFKSHDDNDNNNNNGDNNQNDDENVKNSNEIEIRMPNDNNYNDDNSHENRHYKKIKEYDNGRAKHIHKINRQKQERRKIYRQQRKQKEKEQEKEKESDKEQQEEEKKRRRLYEPYEEGIDGEPVVLIPVVFHVLYSNDNEKLSDEQLQSQISVLNRDFRANNDEINDGDVDSIWKNRVGDSKIEFYLNRTIRVAIADSYETCGREQMMKRSYNGGSDGLDPYTFLNIWTCYMGDGTLGMVFFCFCFCCCFLQFIVFLIVCINNRMQHFKFSNR